MNVRSTFLAILTWLTLRPYEVTGFGTKKRSRNVKIESMLDAAGRPVFAVYRPVDLTCPQDCALLGAGCYAQQGNVNIHQKRSGAESFDPVRWVLGLPQNALVRWSVSGDVVGTDGAEYREAIHVAHTLRPDVRGWSYTHAWSDPAVALWAQSLPSNVRIVASLDDPADEDRARALGWRTVCSVTPTEDGQSFTEEEARAVRASGRLPCPAQRVAIGCADCSACGRDGSIVFAVHGPGRKAAARSLQARRALPLA